MKSGKKYTALGASVRGATHIAKAQPCQDAFLIKEAPDHIIACVADGHGSSRCPYSAEGAEAAVQIAAELLASILKNKTEAFANFDAHKEIWLPKQLEERWKARVKELYAGDEDKFSYELYGTTLLALVAANDFIFVLQIGDGDILVIDRHAQGDWLIPPVTTDGNETYSLCMENCWQYVRTRILPLKDTDAPLMFLLSTDGYANSFTETAGFLKAGVDIYNLWQEKGAAYINQHLNDWLTQSTTEGSGDDITVALVMAG